VARSQQGKSDWLLTACAWGVHLYTALGAAFGLLAIHYAEVGRFRASFLAMAATIVIDSSDGTLARAVRIRQRVPGVDGALLDNIVDYLTFVIVPMVFVMRAGMVPAGWAGLGIVSLVAIASAYQFSQTAAKTPDHYYTGFPSYWNIAVFYLYYARLTATVNAAALVALAVMVFVPIRYIYPSRTVTLRPLTIGYGIFWGAVTIAMILALPDFHPVLLYLSLSYVAYYFAVSLFLNVRNSIASAGPGEPPRI
jgi:phosphatidylcholine synthase